MAPVTVRFTVGPEALRMPAKVVVSTPEPYPVKADVLAAALAAELAAEETAEEVEEVPEVEVDGTAIFGIVVEVVTPEVETVGILTVGAPLTGIVGIFGKIGIELYLVISQLITPIADSTAVVMAPIMPPMILMTPPAIFPTI